MKPIVAALATGCLAVLQACAQGEAPEPAAAGVPTGAAPTAAARADAAARDAFAERAAGRQLQVGGEVVRLLPDDRSGSPHQRFIIETDSGQTLLISHNLDLAPRLDGLAVGDRLVVYGEYEWNDRGGVMHWTHDDPDGRHIAGYIDWRGRRFQ